MKYINLIFLLSINFTVQAQDYYKKGEVLLNESDMIISPDNQYVACPSQQIIINIQSGEEFYTEFKFISFIPNEDKYLGFDKDQRAFVEVDFKTEAFEDFLKINKSVLFRDHTVNSQITNDKKFFAIKGALNFIGSLTPSIFLFDVNTQTQVGIYKIPRGKYSFTFTKDSKKLIYLGREQFAGSNFLTINEIELSSLKKTKTRVFDINEDFKVSSEMVFVTKNNMLIFSIEEDGGNSQLVKFDLETKKAELSQKYTQEMIHSGINRYGYYEAKNILINVSFRIYSFDLDNLKLIHEQKMPPTGRRNGVSRNAKYIIRSFDNEGFSSALLTIGNK